MPEVSTKRELLSAISLTFDPLGICLPVMTGTRLQFQQIHKLEREKKLFADFLINFDFSSHVAWCVSCPEGRIEEGKPSNPFVLSFFSGIFS
jgi:hypothetical protein